MVREVFEFYPKFQGKPIPNPTKTIIAKPAANHYFQEQLERQENELVDCGYVEGGKPLIPRHMALNREVLGHSSGKNTDFVCAMEDVSQACHRDLDDDGVLVCLDETFRQQTRETMIAEVGA